MSKYKKKPVVIEAFIMGIDNMPDWFFDKVVSKDITLRSDEKVNPMNTNPFYRRETYCEINTLEGIMRADYGDYIIKGVQGEIYPCKPNIFAQTYEIVKD